MTIDQLVQERVKATLGQLAFEAIVSAAQRDIAQTELAERKAEAEQAKQEKKEEPK